MKIFHLVSKQTHIAATTFDFKDYEDNSILFMRIYKDSKWHDQWSALQEGDKFTFDVVGKPASVQITDRPEMSDDAKAEIYS